jgi:hypothetical protein
VKVNTPLEELTLLCHWTTLSYSVYHSQTMVTVLKTKTDSELWIFFIESPKDEEKTEKAEWLEEESPNPI